MKIETNSLKEQISVVKNAIAKTKTGKGSIIFVSGEAGLGKTYLAKNAMELCSLSENNIIGLSSESEAPIGKFNISNVMPLKPFAKIIEGLIHNKGVSAQKRFALNVGLTLLTAIPLAGEVFYAAKEISKDWREYKKDKTTETNNSSNEAVTNFYNTICSYATKSPLLLVLEDMQWCDGQSVELIELFAQNIDTLPIVFLISFRSSEVTISNSALYRLVNSKDDNFVEVVLKPLEKLMLSSFISKYMNSYIKNQEFEDYLYAHSFGVPGILAEYLVYFQKHSPFGAEGNLNINLDEDLLPISSQSIITKALEDLSEDEMNVLSCCAAEGKQFTAFIASNLLNTDILSCIRILKSIQRKSGIIKSIGSQSRYGIKTTVYEFTQAFYFKHFESLLEYEEYQALHGLIANILQEKFDTTKSQDLKDEIAPYLAAHSTESGDEETARKMIIEVAKYAQRIESKELYNASMVKYVESEDETHSKGDLETEFNNKTGGIATGKVSEQDINIKNSNGISSDSPIDLISESIKQEFLSIRQIFVKDYHNKNYKNVIESADEYYELHKMKLKLIEKVQLLTLIAKSYIEMNELSGAEEKLKEAALLIEGTKDFKSECFLLNTLANFYSAKGDNENALNTLKKAAQMSLKLPAELRLMTLTNIALILEKTDLNKAKVYFDASSKLTKSLAYSTFNEFLNRN